MEESRERFQPTDEVLVRLVREEVASGTLRSFGSEDLIDVEDLLGALCRAWNGLLGQGEGAVGAHWGGDLPSEGHPIWGNVLQKWHAFRERGADASLFLGLLKDLRRAFLRRSMQGQEGDCAEVLERCGLLQRFFDRAEFLVIRDRLSGDLGDLLTDLQESNRALARQNARWSSLFEVFPAPILVLDEETRVRLMNDRARRLVLRTGEWSTGLTGRPLAEIVPRLDVALRGAEKEEDGWIRVSCALPSPEGERRFQVASRALHSLKDEMLGHLVILKEVPAGEPLREETELWCRTLETALESTRVGLILVDGNGRVLRCNGPIREFLGSGVGPGREFAKALESIEAGWAGIAESVREQRAEVFLVPSPSRGRWYEWRVLPIGDLTAVCCRDVTEDYLREESLRQSEERYALAIQSVDVGLWDHDARKGTTYLSPRLREMLDLSPDWQGDPLTEWRIWAHPEDRVRIEESFLAACRGGQTRWSGELRYRRRSGEWLWFEVRVVLVRNAEGAVVRAVGSLVDVTERHEVQEQMERMALHDTLTGLPNRVLFLDRLNQSLAVARRRGWYFFAVLFLDLDRFKDINDSLGHSAGDEYLKGVARRISECLRAGDTVARLGGDEFAVLLNDLRDPADAMDVAERIQQHLSQPLRIQGQEFIPNASIGLAASTAEYRNAEEVLRDADTAMYRAKEGGRNRIVAFTREMHQEISRRVQLESDLRHAVEAGQFAIFLQPIVDLATDRVTGAEALVRWIHPVLGTRSPGEFINVAEETGLILPIGEFVLREACRTAAAWRHRLPEAGDLTISVNFSARQFTHGRPLAVIREALAESGLPPSCLKIEITESLLLEDLGEIQRMLREIDRMGVRLQLDDFGTGYSSLSYLQRFPIRTIKVDRSFVASIDQTASRELVRAIVTLAQSLHMETIAEGVETQAHLSAVRSLGCRYAQGYLFSRPVASEAFEELLRRGVPWTRGFERTDGGS